MNNKYKKQCTHCSKKFITLFNTKKYCSEQCRISRNVLKRSKLRTQYRISLPNTTRVCKHCGKHFNPQSYRYTCCSIQCYKKFFKHRQPKILINSSYYHPDSKYKYKGNWLKAILRDGKCVLCGNTERLEVHHIDGRGMKCNIEINHSLKNLRTLCYICHRKMDDISWYIKDNALYITCSAFKFAGYNSTIIAPL